MSFNVEVRDNHKRSLWLSLTTAMLGVTRSCHASVGASA